MMVKPDSVFKTFSLFLNDMLGDKYTEALDKAYQILKESPKEKLRKMVGRKIKEIPEFPQLDKRGFVESYQKPIEDDILAGYGLFKITESRMLQMDWTGGHYQLPLGYHFRNLDRILVTAREHGIIDDTHNNTPGQAVKLLAFELIKSANKYDGEVDINKLKQVIDAKDRLNRVTSVDTGTVASGAALKSILYRFRNLHKDNIPVFIMQEGNYHGTDFFQQYLRGMWQWMFTNVIVEAVKPNDIDHLNQTFQKYQNGGKEKVAAVIMEPVLMNNRAIYLKPEYIYRAKELAEKHDAVMMLDEIQTGFWSPDIFMANELKGVADIIAVGKGLTSGFSPLAYMICKKYLDNQDQYSSISTNGNADMAALAGLVVLYSIRENSSHIQKTGEYYMECLQDLQQKHPKKITGITGCRHLAGINIVNENMAKKFHQGCLDQGIFLRLQTYKAGACTIITKPAVIADADDVDFVIKKLNAVLDIIS
ncbi:aminotransferase class III-fold pyridoxal phosphate-dependent enzyme [Candidatus Poribacteria bacterium]|nr:aminotransferase class III-fold pyridoxal phosphate-dependent enzyme [Candidatus Poribacteria bacterium]